LALLEKGASDDEMTAYYEANMIADPSIGFDYPGMDGQGWDVDAEPDPVTEERLYKLQEIFWEEQEAYWEEMRPRWEKVYGDIEEGLSSE
jgi:hypothetical protein